jgi:hypothetical protein
MAGVNGHGMGLPSEESTNGVRMKMKLQRFFLRETHLGGVRCGKGRSRWNK